MIWKTFITPFPSLRCVFSRLRYPSLFSFYLWRSCSWSLVIFVALSPSFFSSTEGCLGSLGRCSIKNGWSHFLIRVNVSGMNLKERGAKGLYRNAEWEEQPLSLLAPLRILPCRVKCQGPGKQKFLEMGCLVYEITTMSSHCWYWSLSEHRYHHVKCKSRCNPYIFYNLNILINSTQYLFDLLPKPGMKLPVGSWKIEKQCLLFSIGGKKGQTLWSY